MSLANGPIDAPRAGGEPSSAPRSNRSFLLVAMASLSLLLGAVFGRHGVLEARQYRLERDRLAQENAELARRNAALAQEVAALRSQPAATERIAREQLGMARPGEKLVLLGAPVEQVPLVPSAPGLDDAAPRP